MQSILCSIVVAFHIKSILISNSNFYLQLVRVFVCTFCLMQYLQRTEYVEQQSPDLSKCKYASLLLDMLFQFDNVSCGLWIRWGCPPSKFPWTYADKVTCYLLEGKVKVYPDGHDDYVEIGAGDLVVFPKGMKCTWDVSHAIDKHYNFGQGAPLSQLFVLNKN